MDKTFKINMAIYHYEKTRMVHFEFTVTLKTQCMLHSIFSMVFFITFKGKIFLNQTLGRSKTA